MKNNFALVLVACLVFFSSCEIKSKKGMIISKLDKAAKVSTLEMVVEKTIYEKDDASIIAKLAGGQEAYFLARTEARIKFGIDLSEIDPETDITIRGDEISILLPPIRMTNFSYPAESFRIDETVSNARDAWLNKKSLDQIEDYYRQAESNIFNTLPKTGVYKTAEDKTIKVFAQILKNLGYSTVHLKFKERSIDHDTE